MTTALVSTEMDKDRPNTVYILVEVKKPKLKDGKNQLCSYCNATGAPIRFVCHLWRM